MKRFLKYFLLALIVTGISISAYFSTNRTIESCEHFQVQGVGLYDRGQTSWFTAQLSQDEKNEINDILKAWWKFAKNGWTPNVVTFIPEFNIDTDKCKFDFLKDIALLQCEVGSYRKKLSLKEIEFIDSIKSKIKWVKK